MSARDERERELRRQHIAAITYRLRTSGAATPWLLECAGVSAERCPFTAESHSRAQLEDVHREHLAAVMRAAGVHGW